MLLVKFNMGATVFEQRVVWAKRRETELAHVILEHGQACGFARATPSSDKFAIFCDVLPDIIWYLKRVASII